MDSVQLYRLLRRRWLILVLFAAIGASLGFASTLLRDEKGPGPAYWTAGRILVSGDESDIDLVRAATVAVVGDVPSAVAGELGVDLNSLGLRAVTNAGRGTITISAVGTDATATLDAAERVADAYLAHLTDQAAADYDSAVAAARTEVDERGLAADDAQAQVDILGSSVEDETELTPIETDRLRRAGIQRDSANLAYVSALEALNALERAGPASLDLSTLQNVRAIRISPAEYRSRIDQADQALNVFGPAEERAAGFAAARTSVLTKPIVRAFLGAFAGLLVALMCIMIHARLDTRLRSRQAIEAAFDLPVLAEVPVMARKDQRNNLLHAIACPYSRVTEAHRYLRSVLLFSRALPTDTTQDPSGIAGAGDEDHGDVRVIMVTSAGAGEGKTTTAANLAVMMAEAGYDTVLMNCDHRRPRVHELFGVPYAPETVTATQIENLSLVTDVRRSAGDSPAQLSERQRAAIANARCLADLVILDTAPILATNDALDLLSATDLVILVAREGRTTIDTAREARELLIDRMGMPVAGVVVTASGSSQGYRYYDRYRTGGYFGPESERSVQSPVAVPAPVPAHAPASAKPAPVTPPSLPQEPQASPVAEVPATPLGLAVPDPPSELEDDAPWLPRHPASVGGRPPEPAVARLDEVIAQDEPAWITELNRIAAEARRSGVRSAAVDSNGAGQPSRPQPADAGAHDDVVIDLRSGTAFRPGQ